MKALFHKEVTIVSPLTKDEVSYLIASKTEQQIVLNELGIRKNKISNLYTFEGVVKESRFTISKISNTAQFFIPKIQVELENSSRGTIILLNFDLSYPSRVLFNSSSCVSGLLSLFFIMTGDVSYSLWSGLALVINYVISRSNFALHVRDALKGIKSTIQY